MAVSIIALWVVVMVLLAVQLLTLHGTRLLTRSLRGGVDQVGQASAVPAVGESLGIGALHAVFARGEHEHRVSLKKDMAVPALFIFMRSDCTYCSRILRHVQADAVARDDLARAGVQTCTLVASGPGARNLAQETIGDYEWIIDEGGEVSTVFHVRGVPSAVLIDESWKVAASGVLGDIGEVHRMLAAARIAFVPSR